MLERSFKLMKKSDMLQMGLPAAEAVATRPVSAALPPEQDRVANRMLEGVRLSFRLPETLHRRLKLHAVRSGDTLVGTIAGWVREHTPAA